MLKVIDSGHQLMRKGSQRVVTIPIPTGRPAAELSKSVHIRPGYALKEAVMVKTTVTGMKTCNHDRSRQALGDGYRRMGGRSKSRSRGPRELGRDGAGQADRGACVPSRTATTMVTGTIGSARQRGPMRLPLPPAVSVLPRPARVSDRRDPSTQRESNRRSRPPAPPNWSWRRDVPLVGEVTTRPSIACSRDTGWR